MSLAFYMPNCNCASSNSIDTVSMLQTIPYGKLLRVLFKFAYSTSIQLQKRRELLETMHILFLEMKERNLFYIYILDEKRQNKNYFSFFTNALFCMEFPFPLQKTNYPSN